MCCCVVFVLLFFVFVVVGVVVVVVLLLLFVVVVVVVVFRSAWQNYAYVLPHSTSFFSILLKRKLVRAVQTEPDCCL